jgi:hypothetical protein
MQATENAWRRIEAEFGLLTAREVAELLGARPTKLLSVQRGKTLRYPGFQFDREARAILPVIEPLINLARANGWRMADVALWLTSPSTSFDAEDRPVDHLREDPDAVLAAAQNAFEAEY